MSGIDMTDILGLGQSTPAPTPGEPPAPAAKKKAATTAPEPETTEAESPLGKGGNPHPSIFLKPVGVTFLASICGKQARQIEKRLSKCPVREWTKHAGRDTPLYNFLEAMAYLVPPKGSIEDWFSNQNAASLPPYVNKMFWDSAMQRNRVMLNSNDLWHTEDVMLLCGRIAMMIRDATKMWIEELPEKELLNEAQYDALMKSTARLVETIRDTLINQPRQTLAMSSHIQSELDSHVGVPSDSDRATEEE